jgi:transposase
MCGVHLPEKPSPNKSSKEGDMGTVYLGIDFHSTKSVFHRIERTIEGKLVRTNGTFYTEDIPRFLETLDVETYVCVEASSGVFEFCEMLQPRVKEVIVIHPLKFRSMYLSGKKTDKVDAKNLADRLKAHIEDDDGKDGFASVWIPPRAVRDLREMFSSLRLLKTQIGMHRNKIRSILRQHMSCRAREDGLECMAIDELDVPATARALIKCHQTLLISILQMKKELEDRIKRAAVGYDEPTMKLLVTIFGVSVMGSSALLADVGCIERFKTAKRFAHYMRSAPRVDSSNKSTRIGSLDKAGRKTAFGYLIEGLVNIYSGNPNFKTFFESKTKGKSKGKVRAALVRKTLTTIFYMWKRREAYRFEHDRVTKFKLGEVEKIKMLIQAS